MRSELIIALTVLVASPALASPELEQEVFALKSELERARREIDRLRAAGQLSVECSRADVARKSETPNSKNEARTLLEKLSGLRAVPYYSGGRLAGYQLLPGCSFLGGDRINAINGVPITEDLRASDVARRTDRWRFTVTERSPSGSPPVSGDRIDLSRALEVKSSEAVVSPATEGGRTDGFLVWSVTPGGYLAAAGLKERDVLIAANGLHLAHGDGEQILAREWRQSGRLNLVVERQGRETALTPIVDASRAGRR